MLTLLPAELTAIDEPEEIATEYLHYRQLFIIWGTIERIVEWQAQEGTAMQGPAATRDARASWVAEYRVRMTEGDFCRSFTDVLLRCRLSSTRCTTRL